jgi:hypothetical protein
MECHRGRLRFDHWHLHHRGCHSRHFDAHFCLLGGWQDGVRISVARGPAPSRNGAGHRRHQQLMRLLSSFCSLLLLAAVPSHAQESAEAATSGRSPSRRRRRPRLRQLRSRRNEMQFIWGPFRSFSGESSGCAIPVATRGRRRDAAAIRSHPLRLADTRRQRMVSGTRNDGIHPAIPRWAPSTAPPRANPSLMSRWVLSTASARARNRRLEREKFASPTYRALGSLRMF